MLIHPRSEVFGSDMPCNRDGSPRPRLAPCRWLTVHWVGAGQWGDPGDTPSEMRSIHAFSMSPGKGTPWEYGYVIDAAGEAWTYAGEYLAAHSAGENAEAIGVLLLAGPGEPITDAMVLTFRQLRYELARRGALTSGHEVRPHQWMPGANTSCPGPAMARLVELATPWSPPPPEPEPTPEPIVTTRSVDMIVLDFEPDTDNWTALILEAGELRHLQDGNTVDVLAAASVPRQTITEAQFIGVLRDYQADGPCPVPAPSSALLHAWNNSAGIQ